MSGHRAETEIRLDALQRAFDATFAQAPRADPGPQDNLLAITIGGDPYAIRLAEVAGLYFDRQVTGLPGAVAGLRGLVGLRGALLPVYDLGALLGYPNAASLRWCLVAADASVALAFEQFEGHLRVPSGAFTVASAGQVANRPRCVREAVHIDDRGRPVIHVPSVLEVITVLAHHATRPKE